MNNKSNVPIVVVAYNRPRSLQRLLSSLSKATYGELSVTLFISIDYGENNQDVLEVATNFKWIHGDKQVLYQDANLGLKRHVIQCASLVSTYEGIIMLEDDLIVSPFFYSYALRALRFSEDKDYVGGVSLYNHQLNVHTTANFSPIEDGYDNWYFQFASSWGQAWTKKQWQNFSKWYASQDNIEKNPIIPENVTSWSEKSWLKFFITYLIEKNKYFIYPRTSYTSNFSEVGTHNVEDSTAFQVPLSFGMKKYSSFSTLEQSNSVYDSFFENKKLENHCGVSDLCVNLYNYKPINLNEKFILTTKILDFKIIKKYGCSLKPIDANILQEIDGKDIFLYDCSIKEKNNFSDNKFRRLTYNYKIIKHSDSLFLCKKITINRAQKLLNRILNVFTP